MSTDPRWTTFWVDFLLRTFEPKRAPSCVFSVLDMWQPWRRCLAEEAEGEKERDRAQTTHDFIESFTNAHKRHVREMNWYTLCPIFNDKCLTPLYVTNYTA